MTTIETFNVLFGGNAYKVVKSGDEVKYMIREPYATRFITAATESYDEYLEYIKQYAHCPSVIAARITQINNNSL